MLRTALLASSVAVLVGATAPAAIAESTAYLAQLRQLELAPVMPPVAYGFSVGASHIPQIPVDVYGVPQYLEAGASAFERADYSTALYCFQRAGSDSALGRFDAGLTQLFLGEDGGYAQMQSGESLARRQGFAELAQHMRAILDKLGALHLSLHVKHQ